LAVRSEHFDDTEHVVRVLTWSIPRVRRDVRLAPDTSASPTLMWASAAWIPTAAPRIFWSHATLSACTLTLQCKETRRAAGSHT
jgi:hypothetical protein